MDEGKRISQEVVTNGHRLIITATETEEAKWMLTISNEQGCCTNWLEYFTSAPMAIDAGLKAIEKEGAEEFLSNEGFEYLYE